MIRESVIAGLLLLVILSVGCDKLPLAKKCADFKPAKTKKQNQAAKGEK